MGILERESVPKEARKCSAAQGSHSEVVPRAFWRLVSKSCDECKGSFARGCEAKRLSHWTCSSLGTIFQPMRINSVPDVKCFCNNKNVLCVQSMVWHFVRNSIFALNSNILIFFLSGKRFKWCAVEVWRKPVSTPSLILTSRILGNELFKNINPVIFWSISLDEFWWVTEVNKRFRVD